MNRSISLSSSILASSLLFNACEFGSDTVAATADAIESTEDTTTTAPAPSAAEQYACVDDDFSELKPLSGAGLDPEKGFLGERQERYVVHTTQLVVPPEGMEGFGADMSAIFGAMAEADGLIAVSLASSAKCGFNRTLGVWRDEAAMWAFVASPAHVKAMTNTTDYATAGRVEHWEATADEVLALTWEAAIARLDQQANSPVFGTEDRLE